MLLGRAVTVAGQAIQGKRIKKVASRLNSLPSTVGAEGGQAQVSYGKSTESEIALVLFAAAAGTR